jgi:hypothetical protein
VDVYNSAGERIGSAAAGIALWQPATGLSSSDPVVVPELGQAALITIEGSQVSFGWDGRNSGGQLVASGTYTLKLELTDPFGTVTSFSVQVTVLRDPQTATVSVYNPAGELIDQWPAEPLAAGSATVLSLTAGAFIPPAAGGSAVGIRYGSGGETVAWDGLDAHGQLVAPGTYLIAVSSTKGGSMQRWQRSVTVLEPDPSNPLAGLRAGPNPAGPSDTEIRLLVPDAPAGLAMVADIYDLAGERVCRLTRAADGYLHWPLNTHSPASGLYVAVVQALDAQGRETRTLMKLGVVR